MKFRFQSVYFAGLLIVAVLGLASGVRGDVVYLNNGTKFVGTVVDSGGGEVQVETASGVMTFKRSDIARIEESSKLENTLLRAQTERNQGDFYEAVSLYADALKMPDAAAKKNEILKQQEEAIRDFLSTVGRRDPLTNGLDDIARIEKIKTILSNPVLLDLLQAKKKTLDAQVAQAYYDEAKRLETNGELEPAIEHYRVVLEHYPNHPLSKNLDRKILDLYLLSGEQAYKNNSYMPSAQARAAFSEALQRSPDNPKALFYLGRMELDDKNYQKARELLDKVNINGLNNREMQERAQMLERIDRLTQQPEAPRITRPAPQPTPTPEPPKSMLQRTRDWMNGGWKNTSKALQDFFSSPGKAMGSLWHWGQNLLILIAALIVLWYIPMKLVLKDLPNRRVVYYNWRKIVNFTGVVGLVAYYIDRWYREEPTKRCPKCNRSVNNPDIFENYEFEKCPYCEAVIKPPFTLPEIIQQRSQMIAVSRRLSGGSQDEAQREEMINLLNLIMVHARKIRASDIHVEPEEGRILVRYRVDGVITESIPLDGALVQLFSSCIKILSNLNIAERRLPQDGHFRRMILKEEINVRVSTIPTRMGEKVVMRLLDQKLASVAIDSLGMRDEPLEKYRRAIVAPHGLILATGPTGSGKTTLHYASLQYINDGSKNIVTVEDPIEYELDGINQIQHNTKTGLTFATALRSILRQDPDVIMVGEIRDLETAGISVNAALTGHLVFSTLHTIDTSTAISRLIDIGVDVKLISSALLGIVAQRLVRKLCPHCKKKSTATAKEIAQLGQEGSMLENKPIYRPRGCKECLGTGYIGRTGIYELLIPDKTVRNLIEVGGSTMELRQASMKSGMKTLRTEGVFKIHSGVTSIEEVVRVTTDDVFAETAKETPDTLPVGEEIE
ncbi:MAG: tetratricopeptide repeat protein [bacterium]|nr:tetratricopeptide repeat protein [bacterium]